MLDNFIEMIQNGMLAVFRFPELVTVFISILPIVEARGAIPMAIGMGLSPLEGWLYAFVGSSIIVPILLLVLLPFINWLGKTRLFKKAANVIYEKFESKSRGIGSSKPPKNGETAKNSISNSSGETAKNSISNSNGETAKNSISAANGAATINGTSAEIIDPTLAKKTEWKKFWGVLLFVAIPLPLTGVWTGSAVAAILKLKYPKAILSVVGGNLIASGIITLLCAFFNETVINYIILAIGIIAIVVVITLIVKIILHKPKESTNSKDSETTNINDDSEVK